MSQNEVKIRLSVDGGAQVQGALSGADAQLQKLNSNLIKTAHYGAGLLVLAPTLREMAAGLIGAADAVTTLNSRLLLATGSAERAASAYEALFQIAQRSRTSFTELGATFAAVARAGQTLGLSQQRLLGVTEAIGNAMTISGGSAQGMQAALTQLGQGLASGTLRGEELNSVMEQAPRLAKALADGLGVPIGQLRKLGETGALTSQMVITALEKSAPQLAKELASASLTVGQAFTVLSNSAVKFTGEADRATGASATLAGALKSVAGALDGVGETIAEHSTAFKVIGGTLAGAATVAGVLALGKGLVTLAGALGGIGVAVAALNPVTLAILGVGVVAGGAVAASAAYDKTASGIKRLIGQLEGADAELLRLRAVLQANPGDIITGQYVKELERDTPKRIESLRALRQELALLNAGSAGSVAEDARLDRGTQAFAERTARATALAEVMGKLSGVNADFLKNLQTLHASYAAGETTLTAYRAQVADLINKEGGGKEMLAKAAAATRNGNEALAERIALMARLYGGKDGARSLMVEDLRRSEIAETDAVNARLLADTMASQAKATEAAAKARADLVKQLDASADSVAAQVQKLQAEEKAAALTAASNISLAEAIELVTIARLQEQRGVQLSFGDEDAAEAIQREIDKRRELAGLIAGKEARQAAADSAKDAAAEWKKTADSLNDSLTDALYRAFESGKGFGRTLRDSLVNTFKTMVLRPIISAIVNPVAGFATGALGLSGAASAGTSAAGSAASSAAGSAAMSTLASMFPSLAAGASAFGNTLLAAGQSFIGMAGTAAQTSASLAAAGYGAGTASGGAIAAGSSAGLGVSAAIPYVAIAAVVANALGLFRSKKQTDSGLVGTLGSGNISDASVIRTGGTLFKGPDYRTNISGVSAGSRTLQDAFEGLRVSTAAQAAALGVSTYSIRNFTTAIGTDVINNDAGTKGLRLQGLTAEQAQAKIAEALQSANEQLAALALAGSNFGRNGETAVQTLARLSGSLSTVNGVLGVLGGRLYATSLAGGEMASKLADLFGGLGNFQSTTGAYFEAFFSEAERAASLTGQLSQQMRALGFSMPSSREGFRKLVEAQDLTTDAGRRTYAALLQLSGAFAVVVAESDASTKAADRAAAAAQRSATALSQRLSIEERILRAQGNTAELRRRELAALDATNRVLQQRLYDIEDAAAAAEEAGKLRDAWRSVGDTIADEVARMQAIDTGAGTAISDGQTAYTQATAAFTIATAQARSGVLSAAEALPELARKLLDLAGASAHSSAELALAHSSVGASLLQTAAIAGALGSPKTIGVIANPFEGDSHSGGTYENPFSGAIGDAIGSIAREIREFFHINYSDTVGESGIDWANLNGYASGGYHAGGWRIVGENGPELEATGPARIYPADQTARLLSGGSDQGSMLAELRAQRIATARLEAELQRVTAALQGMRAETQATAVSTNKSTRQLQEVIDRGVLVRTDADTPLATVAA